MMYWAVKRVMMIRLIKKKYREQIKEFHPDYIQGKGLNDEIIKFAEQKMKQINRAYLEIKKERKNNNT